MSKDKGKQTFQILVVDDSSSIRKGLKHQLSALGAEVTTAKDGLEGLELALASKYHLIISDIEMPNLDGLGLCKKLKETPRTKATPVIILSSHDTEKDIEKGFEVGAAAYLSKSEAPKRIKEVITEVLSSSSMWREHLILVVDDSANISDLVTNRLEEAGFQVMTANNGKQALQRIKEQRPDLILSDIKMPEMDGIAFCKAVRADPLLMGIPFVIMSENSQRGMVRRLLNYGVTTFLVKPFNLEQLVVTIEKLLSDQFLLLLKDKERLDQDRRMMLASITSLVRALEARDYYTRGHSEEVSAYLCQLATHMNLDSDVIAILGVAGRLHDIGKIGVPDSILLKPGKLTAEEFGIIKKHPVMGATILQSIESLTEVITVVQYHHERFDGKGYPEGLRGEQIPLWARMTAVSDTVDAITSDRPYQRGRTMQLALQIIEDSRGTQLCPECVDAFIGMAATKMRD